MAEGNCVKSLGIPSFCAMSYVDVRPYPAKDSLRTTKKKRTFLQRRFSFTEGY